MYQLFKNYYRIVCVLSIVLLALVFLPQSTYAQWPPFRFRLNPAYADGRITYNVDFRSLVDWQMTDVTIKIPLPKGTRFVEGNAQASTTVTFDGAEVTFFTYGLSRNRISVASFTVEVIDPKQTLFVTHAWISWKGAVPGDYLTNDFTLDTTRQPLNWTPPLRSRLQLEASALVNDNIITYNFYPKNTRGGRASRMWDLNINVPIPTGTALISANAPPPFVAASNEHEVNFSILELSVDDEIGPLTFTVSTQTVTEPSVVTRAQANWKNWVRRAGAEQAEESLITGDILAQPHASQTVVADMTGDAAFSNYDLSSLTLESEPDALTVVFHMVDYLCPADDRLQFEFYIDSDCNSETGTLQSRGIGADYQLRYRNWLKKAADTRAWNSEENRWGSPQLIDGEISVSGKTVMLRVPADLVNSSRQFCWAARARHRSDVYVPNPPTDWLPDSRNSSLANYKAAETKNMTKTTSAKSGTSPATLDPKSAAEDLAQLDAAEACRRLLALPAAAPPAANIGGEAETPQASDQGQ